MLLQCGIDWVDQYHHHLWIPRSLYDTKMKMTTVNNQDQFFQGEYVLYAFVFSSYAE